jgi:hypothetical protein
MNKKTGNDLFIVDNSDDEWKVLNYLSEWSSISSRFDIATGYFEIGALLALEGKWQSLEEIRILMGDEVTKRTQRALVEGICQSQRSPGRQASNAKSRKTTFFPAFPPSLKPDWSAARSSAAFTTRRSSTPRLTSRTANWRSWAHRRWSAPATSHFPA